MIKAALWYLYPFRSYSKLKTGLLWDIFSSFFERCLSSSSVLYAQGYHRLINVPRKKVSWNICFRVSRSKRHSIVWPHFHSLLQEDGGCHIYFPQPWPQEFPPLILRRPALTSASSLYLHTPHNIRARHHPSTFKICYEKTVFCRETDVRPSTCYWLHYHK